MTVRTLCSIAIVCTAAYGSVLSAQGRLDGKGLMATKGLEGDKGPPGDKGPTGDKGPVGDKGPASGGATGWHVRKSPPYALGSGSGMPVMMTCGFGRPVGGGVLSSNPSSTLIGSSYPIEPGGDPTAPYGGWRTFVMNTSSGPGAPITVTAYAVCMNAAP